MDVRCDKCGTEYEFDENRIGPNGVTVKCTNCGHVFKVRRPARRSAIPRASTTIGEGPQGKEWLVRKPDGQMIAFRELTTLQKWIVEGRIQRDDEISKNGETWKRLGNIMELEPFFSVYEKAQTLNSLIEQQPVELRGSELLAAVNPIEGAPSSHAYPIPSRSQILQADPLPSQLPSQVPQPLQPRAPSAAPLPAEPAPSGPMPSLPGAPIPDALTPPPLPQSPNPAQDTQGAPNTNLAGPAALERTIGPAGPPASFQTNTLDFPGADDEFDIDDDDDPVESFERGQRNKRVLVGGLLLVALALGASVAVAMYGPPDNSIRALAVQYGLMQPGDTDDGVTELLESARQAADRDTVASQTEAIDLLGQANAKRPSDLELLADRAMRVALLAETYGQWASDLDEDAQAAQAALDAWQAADKKTRGAKPNGVDLEPTRAQAQRHRVRAEKLIAQAAPWLEQAEAEAKGASQTLRARAATAAAQKSADRAVQLDAAKTAAKREGQTDPILLYLEAALALEQGVAGYGPARAALQQAVTARPSFLRARALSARLHLIAGEFAAAERDLAEIVRAAPAHEEAKRLEVRLARAKEAAEAPPPPPPPPVEPAPKPPKKDFSYWMKRGDRLRRQDRTMQALNAYGRAAELKPSSAEVHVGKGWCLLDLDRPHPALAAFERAVKVNRRYAEAYYGKGEALRAVGRKEAAAEAYRAYLEKSPNGSERRVIERRLEELTGG